MRSKIRLAPCSLFLSGGAAGLVAGVALDADGAIVVQP